MHLILLGAPGSGKGTQATRLVSHYHLAHISTGEMLREAVASQTDLGALVEHYLGAGRLVPDHHVTALVEERLSRADARNGFIMDGYPRTKGQMVSFDEIMSSKRLDLDGIILIQVPDEVVIERLSGRRIDPETGMTYNLNVDGNRPPPEIVSRLEQRDDDKSDVVRKRLDIFHHETDTVIDHYRSLKQLVFVDGNRPPDLVFQDITSKLDSVAQEE